MIEDKKYALLDTDFLYKSYLAQDDAQNTLADIVISFQEYEFFCHSIGFGNRSNLEIDCQTMEFLNIIFGILLYQIQSMNGPAIH